MNPKNLKELINLIKDNIKNSTKASYEYGNMKIVIKNMPLTPTERVKRYRIKRNCHA